MDKKTLKKPKKDYKFRKRYLAFEASSKNKLNFSKLADAIRISSVGIEGQSMPRTKVMNTWNNELQRGIVRVSHANVSKMISALSSIRQINSDEIAIRTLGQSGILRKAVNKYLKIAS